MNVADLMKESGLVDRYQGRMQVFDSTKLLQQS
jgi:hypothetical protein